MKNKLFYILIAGILAVISCNVSNSDVDEKQADNLPISDNFDRADGDLGSNWVVNTFTGSSFMIKGNQAKPTASATDVPFVYYNETVSGNILVEVKLIASGGIYSNKAFILAFSSSTSNFYNAYYCGISKLGTLELAQSKAAIIDPIQYGTTVLTLNDGNTATLSFSLNSSSLTCTIRGAVSATLSMNSSTFTEGYIGLHGGVDGENFLSFDDFSITQL